MASTITDLTTDNPVKLAMKEIMGLVPEEKMLEIAEEHLKTDEEFQAVILYMKSEEWTSLIAAIKKTPEWKEYRTITEEIFGIDIEEISNSYRRFIDKTETIDTNITAKRSLRSFLQDLRGSLPEDKILNIFVRIANSPRMGVLKSDRLNNAFENLTCLPEFKKFLEEFRRMDFNIKVWLPQTI